MSYLFTQVFPAIQTLKILGDVDKFQKWASNEHTIENNKQIFDGYLFAIGCCLNTLIEGLANDYQLKIENDFLFERSLHQILPLHKMGSICEKAILLKRLNPYLKDILKSKSYIELSKTLNSFQSNILYRFDQLFDDMITVSSKKRIPESIILKLSLINFAHMYLVQINNNGPVANSLNPISPNWLNKEREQYCFEGYKYALQYLWYKLLGRKVYNSTTLIRMHLADSWRKYKYLDSTTKYNFTIPQHNFNLNDQTCLDSYFWRIKDEITDKLEIKHEQILHTIDTCFKFNSRSYSKKKYFSDLLTGLTSAPTLQLSIDEKIQETLYWYPFEIIGGENTATNLGIPSFNTMLAGTVSLKNKETSAFPNTITAKFIHPVPGKENKNDYSYGILVDSNSAAGHNYCGWVIYQNVCGDYSGFSGKEYRKAEELIHKYHQEGNLEIRELTVSLVNFMEFTEKYAKVPSNPYTFNKNITDILQKSRAYCFELFTFYLHSRFYKDKFDTITLNTDKKSRSGERDVLLYNETEVLLIECKLNTNNYDLKKEIKKIKNKLNEYKQPQKSCALWCWHEPSTQNKSLLKENNIPYVIVSMQGEAPALKGVSLKTLRYILNDSDALDKSQ